MNWQEVCERSDLHNLPFKIELDEQGKVIMSPVKVYHSAFQGKIGALLDRSAKWQVLTECAIKTSKGTKVADIAWASGERFKQIIAEVECSIAPEICVEIGSSTNTSAEIEEKQRLYFDTGCQEGWICSTDGQIACYNRAGRIENSILIPQFPQFVDLFA